MGNKILNVVIPTISSMNKEIILFLMCNFDFFAILIAKMMRSIY